MINMTKSTRKWLLITATSLTLIFTLFKCNPQLSQSVKGLFTTISSTSDKVNPQTIPLSDYDSLLAVHQQLKHDYSVFQRSSTLTQEQLKQENKRLNKLLNSRRKQKIRTITRTVVNTEVQDSLKSVIDQLQSSISSAPDTVIKDSIVYITKYPQPLYDRYQDSHISLTVMGPKVYSQLFSQEQDSSLLRSTPKDNYFFLSTTDTLSIYHTTQNPLFKPKTHNVVISSTSPYSSVDTRSYSIDTRPKRLSLGVHLGYGTTYRNQSFQLAPTLSLGLNYNLLNIK